VRNLGVKHKVAVKVVLVDQGRLIFAEVMEDLHDTLWLHDLLQAMLEGIDCQQVEDEGLPCKVHLKQRQRPVFREPLAIDAQDRGRLAFEDCEGDLLDFFGGGDYYVGLVGVENAALIASSL
jgi:hypothetical protein